MKSVIPTVGDNYCLSLNWFTVVSNPWQNLLTNPRSYGHITEEEFLRHDKENSLQCIITMTYAVIYLCLFFS